jgi:hypothetical protein
MKKEKVNELVVVLLVAFSVLAVVSVFVNSGLKMTGFAVISQYDNQTSCEEAGYTWEEITNESCETIEDCEVCEEGCVQEYTQILCEEGCVDNCTSGCVEDYTEVLCEEGCQENCENCTEIVVSGQCVGDVCDADHLDLCLDETSCGGADGHWYNELCNANEECVPGTCSSLGYDCGSVDDGCGTTLDCGECEDEEETTTQQPLEEEENLEEDIPVLTTESNEEEVCASNWQCGEWTECISNTQSRECTDANNCGIEEGKPAVTQACTPAETCTDGIKNQDERGIDCGGACERKCGFFVMVGSAVKVPLNSTKNFLKTAVSSNKALSIVVISALILGLVGIITFRTFFKGEKPAVITKTPVKVTDEF